MKKCLEVERLQIMTALKDKRIKELEAHIEMLSLSGNKPVTTHRQQSVRS